MMSETQLRIEAEELAWVAQSYLIAAERLVEAVITDKEENDAYWSRAPLYLCYHGVELYYKAALAAEGAPVRNDHNLFSLRRACASIPDCDFSLPIWLGGELHRTADLFEDDVPKLYFDSLHQTLRYVTDKKGRALRGPPKVVASELLEEIRDLRHAAMRILLRLGFA